MKERETSVAWSRVQGKQVEIFNGNTIKPIEKTNNPESLMQAVLKNRGFDSLVQMYLEKDNPRKIPVDILREIVLADSLDVDPVTKTKLAIYRVWAQDGHYSRVKEYFPETSFGLEQIQTTLSGRNKPVRTRPLEEYVNEVMMDEGELGRNYNIIHYRAEIIDKLLPWTYGLIYIRKFELLAKINNEVTTNNTKNKISKETIEQIISKYEREVVDLEHRLRSETRLEKSKSQRESEELNTLLFLRNVKRLTRREIAKKMGKSLKWVKQSISFLYIKEKIEPIRPYSRDRELLKEQIICYSAVYSLDNPGKKISLTKMKKELRISSQLLKQEYLSLLKNGYILPELEVSRKMHNRELIEQKIISSVEGMSSTESINITRMYKDGNFKCSKVTFYNIYHALAKRIDLPPVKHGGRRCVN